MCWRSKMRSGSLVLVQTKWNFITRTSYLTTYFTYGNKKTHGVPQGNFTRFTLTDNSAKHPLTLSRGRRCRIIINNNTKFFIILYFYCSVKLKMNTHTFLPVWPSASTASNCLIYINNIFQGAGVNATI